MKNRSAIFVLILILLVLTACDKEIPDPVFHISGSPDPVKYGCGNTLTFKVVGPGDNIRVDSVIVSYNLYNSSGKKVETGSISLIPSPAEPPTTYIGSVTLSIPGGSGSTDPSDIASIPFGEGRVEFGGFVDARFISSPDAGPWKPVGHTEEKSIPVIPCLPTPTPKGILPGGMDIVTIEPPGSADKPSKPGESGGPPSCSAEPNNPSCVP